MASPVPVLETRRLTLRAHGPDDLEAYATLWADPVVTRHTSGRALSREEAWVRILRYAGHWSLFGFGFWIIAERENGRVVGEAGFHELKRALAPAIEGTPEAGWLLAPDLHGRGYASEAVAAIHSWSDRCLAGEATVCLIHPDNAASLRVAETAGYHAQAHATYHGGPTIILRREARRG